MDRNALPAVPELLRAAGLGWRWMTPDDRGFVCWGWLRFGCSRFLATGRPLPRAGLERTVDEALARGERRLLGAIWKAEAAGMVDARLAEHPALVIFDETMPSSLIAWRHPAPFGYTKEAARRQGLQRAMRAALAQL